MTETPRPVDPSEHPLEAPQQTPQHVPDLPPMRDPDPQQEQG